MIDRKKMAQCDSAGMIYLTMHEGRVVIILPTLPPEQADPLLARIVSALSAVGLQALINERKN